jgi:uncharacterized membrane protein HdeD (DUF308 family)
MVSDAEVRREAGAWWWLFLVTGAGWLLLTVLVFRFEWSTVASIAILFGIAMLGAACVEVVAFVSTTGWWKVAHALLAAAFVVIGIVSFIHPGNTFRALAALMSFYFIIRGGFGIAVALAFRHENDLWWLGLTVGIVEVLLAFWAAGDFTRKAILLVVFVGAMALTRAINDFLLAFQLRRAAREA